MVNTNEEVEMTQEQKNRLEAIYREQHHRHALAAARFEKIENALRDQINAAWWDWQQELREIREDTEKQVDAVFEEEA